MLQTDNIKIQERAKAKADGVYTFKGFYYAVKNGKAVLTEEPNLSGDIYQELGMFRTKIGNVRWRAEIPKEMKKLLKKM
jgi:hypothetical protein